MGYRSRGAWIGLAGLGLLVAASAVRAEDGVTAQAAFAQLKTLAGEWKVEVQGHGDEKGHAAPSTITYKVTGGGKVVMETFFPGTDHEMVSMYHLDGDELRATHYCAAGNQPRLKLDRKASTADLLVFGFDGGSNLDPAKDVYIHGGRIQFKDAKLVEAAWEAYKGPEKFHTETFTMRRP